MRYGHFVTKGQFPTSLLDTIVADRTDSLLTEDSLFAITPDSVYLKPLDSLRIASEQADTLHTDSVRKKDNGLDQPVKYVARDSMTYSTLTHDISLYGSSEVEYQDMDLKADLIRMNTDSSLVHATFSSDSLGNSIGKPVFTQRNDSYEMDKISYNFKSRKGYITLTER